MVLIVHRVEEVTELIRARGGPGSDSSQARVLEAELYTRARELQEVNERLRRAHEARSYSLESNTLTITVPFQSASVLLLE